MKKIYTGILLLTITLLFRSSVFGETLRTDSNPPATTKVGTPSNPSGTILPWTIQISDALQTGFDGSYDKMVSNITNGTYTAPQSPGTSTSNKYWCTYLVIDSYNLAGFSGLSRAHAGAVNMLSFWKTNAAYTFLDYYNNNHMLDQVQPGYSILFQDNPGQTSIGDFDHAAIVKDINVDSHGNGTLNTYDSNLPGIKGVPYTLVDWEIHGSLKNVCTSPGVCHPNYSVMGFGTTK